MRLDHDLHTDTIHSEMPASTRRPFLRSPVAVALIASFTWVAVYNRRFWSETLATLSSISGTDIAFLVSLFGVIWALHALVLVLLPGRRLLKTVAAFLFVAASVGAYFADTYGISIDREAIRNLVETDRREALALFNARFLFYFCVLGVVPAALIIRLRLNPAPLKQQLVRQGAVFGGAALLVALSVALLGAHYASFLREHKAVRLLVTPANIVYAVTTYVTRVRFATAESGTVDLESPVRRVPSAASTRPLVVFLVIGETARNQNFQLGGYGRATNPELMKRRVDYFSNVTSCGTSTAISLPCMFSGLGRDAFDVARAQRNTNLLDALAAAGFRVEWRDNNSGCKGLCARVASIDYMRSPDPTLCSKTGCYDEVMLTGLAQELAQLKSDKVIVFHQAGSHGPAYSDRYPRSFEAFKPVCYGNELSRCAVEHVVNAYDNSILYTDHNLARQIDMLSAVSATTDSILIYVSDHGESLGEKGLYLHGAPFLFAPEQQINVPLLVWMSEGYRRRFAVSDACLRARKAERFSHDNLYHTVLGASGVTSARYRSALDMFAECRSAL